MELVVRAGTEGEAEKAEGVVLGEIERLRRILSTYDPESEISRLNRTQGTMRCSAELIEVLGAYEVWQKRSGGAYSGQMGELVRVWREAERRQTLPDAAELGEVARRSAMRGWRIDAENRTVTRVGDQALNVDSIGKGYIIGKAVAKAREVKGVRGILLSIGGDVLATGEGAWQVGVADPRCSFDNAPPLTRVRVGEGAVATSGSYERGYWIGGTWHSHILDPRTGWAADGVASATVVAGDNVTANALATTLCVLGPTEGLRLVESMAGTECLIVTAEGEQFRSKGFAAMEEPRVKEGKEKGGWPKDYQVSLTLTLKKPTGRRAHRPYVAVWVEDGEGRRVRTITVWGNERKYLKELPAWWKVAKEKEELVAAVTRATRPAGRYQLVWDGLDDAGKPVGAGTYTIVVEVNREKGTYSKRSGTIVCGEEKAKGKVEGSAEFEEVVVEYGAGGKE